MTVSIKDQRVVVVPVNPKILGLETTASKNTVILNDTMANAINGLFFGSEETPITHNGQIIVPLFLAEEAIRVFEAKGTLDELFEKCWNALFELEKKYKEKDVQLWVFASWETSEKFLMFSGNQAYFLRPELVSDRHLFFIQQNNKGVEFNPILESEEIIWFQ